MRRPPQGGLPREHAVRFAVSLTMNRWTTQQLGPARKGTEAGLHAVRTPPSARSGEDPSTPGTGGEP
jgi:hypothetical protein